MYAWFLLLGCPKPEVVDQDDDGVAAEADCDDADPERYPGNIEVCDGIDNDCSGEVDDGLLSTFFADADGDGFGDPGSAVDACSAPAGAIEDDRDCDDSSAAVNPDATEICNGIDDDCDPATDEDDGTEANPWFTDADGDGFGTGASFTACAQPADTSDVDGDCDDAAADVNPTAVEICNGVDDDCDPATLEPGASDWFTDADMDGFGTGTPVSSCMPPPGTSDVDGDCDDQDDGVNPGAAEICDNGLDENCVGGPDDGCVAIEHCGNITADETWGPGEHLVTCTISVTEDATLTLAEGANVRFDAGTALTIGTLNSTGGNLVAEDLSDTLDVLMTSSSSTPTPGDWNGVHVRTVGTVDLAGTTLAYAGGNFGAINVDGSLVLTDATVEQSSGRGIFVANGASVLIEDTRIADNGGHGVELEVDAILAGAFTGNTVTANSGAPLRLFADHVGLLSATSTYVGNDSRVLVGAANATIDAIWEAIDSGLLIETGVIVGHANDPQLEILAGLDVEFGSGAHLRVGTLSPGGLRVSGTAGSRVRFFGDGTVGFWNSLELGPLTSMAVLYGLDVEDAGDSVQASAAAIELEGVVDADLGDITVVRSGRRGIHAHSGTILALNNSIIEDNVEVGVEIDPNSFIDASLGFGNNIVAQNASPLRMNVDQVVNLDSNVLTGNTLDAVTLIGGNASTTGSWQSWGVPYIVEQGFNIQGGAVLTMQQGTQLLMGGGQSLRVGTSGAGGLVADGWVVGSANPTPTAGDWGAVIFGDQCLPSSSSITNSTLSYGGRQPTRFGTVEFLACDGSIDDTLISDSAYHGVYVSLGTSATVGIDVFCSGVAEDCQHFD